MKATPWLDVLDEAIRSCAAHDRADLAGRLRARRAELAQPAVRVVVLGAAGQGKSQLLNGLLGSAVCAVGDDLTTTVPAVVKYSASPSAMLVPGDPAPMIGSEPADSLVLEGPAPAVPALTSGDQIPVPVEHATADANRRSGVARVEVGLPRKLLETGLRLIDTPPCGGDGGEHARAALATLPQADAVLLASDVTRDLSADELAVMERVLTVCPTAAVVLTKTDLVPGWQRVAERNRARLEHHGLPVALFPVSSTLRMLAAKTNDTALNDESGYPALISYLHHELMGNVDVLRRRSAGALTRLAVERVVPPLRERLAELQQGGDGELTARYRAASRKLDRLQRESARWQTILSDEVADLTADLDYDLRDRTRRILREADEYFETADPVKDWPEFEEWLRDNLRSAAEANSGWLLDRFEWITRKLAAVIEPPRSELFEPDSVLHGLTRDELDELRMPNVEKFTLGQKLFVGMRGSYSGLLMFGLATTLAGMDLINPISLGAGVAFGAKSVFEERGTRLKRRQATARTAAHRYVDDFFLAYGKESKDTVRLIHRELRDRCTAVAHELRTEISDGAQRVKQVIDAETAERGTAMREVARRIDELDLLRRRAEALAPRTVVRGLTA
ncbi:GTP-binding protein [Saccharomonospora piscinae]|uniref:GTP-binding protein n=1 Tax=Saccharomonospora piscinae TaxID=687388 RepID=A0A1V9A740_SACPI|nr:dynamin family protein [Saccharomonospora piscinae]OQO92949.1 GTP-binding protein [Saccharomonospora piscinae]